VHIVPVDMPKGVEPRVLEKLTEAAFGQRRKMLRSSLRALPGGLESLDRLGIDASRRAETVGVAEFVAIARELTARA
jgi:16S rRNA (adenine1518-N6/adenine1519-N6)-dimethyltransferase